MRFLMMLTLCLAVLVGVLACNSNETLLSQSPKSANPASTTASPPADNVRRITAQELHALWEKDQVFIIDTRTDAAHKQEHIRGAMLVPPGTVLSKLDQIPRNKMIVAYCA